MLFKSKLIIVAAIFFIAAACEKSNNTNPPNPSGLSLSQTLLKNTSKTWISSDSSLEFSDLPILTMRFVNANNFLFKSSISLETGYSPSSAVWSASADSKKLTLSWVDTFLPGMGPKGQMPQTLTFHISSYDTSKIVVSGMDSAGVNYRSVTEFGVAPDALYFY